MHHLIAVIFATLALAAARPAVAQPVCEGGQAALIITYQTSPANRLAFRRQMSETGLARLEGWRQQGLIKNYRLLASRYADAGAWDVMVVLGFASADLAAWKAVEATAPAGLTEGMAALVSSISTAPVDLTRRSGTAPKTGGVFLVIPYQYLVPVGDYVGYLDGYTLPQLEGWIGESVLAQYSLFLSRYPAGRPWNAMLLLDYRDEEALARREEVVAKVRARLKQDPDWKAWADNKKSIRSEGVAVIADEISPADKDSSSAKACF